MQRELIDLFVRLSRTFVYIFLAQLLACQLLLAGTLSGQSLEEVKVSVARYSTVEEVLSQIEATSDFSFFYSKQVLKRHTGKIHIFPESDLRTILLKLSKSHNLRFRRINNAIYISRKQSDDQPAVIEIPSDFQIGGVVLDGETREPLIGATIKLANKSIGTITDIHGAFSLNVPDSSDMLVISSVGYQTISLPIKIGVTEYEIILKPKTEDLEAVVVVGYTSAKTRDIIGAISIVDESQIKSLPVAGLDQALQGQVPGVQVSSTGAPGAEAVVRIRGFATVGDNNPLYIVDGVPTKSGLNQFNLNDVESVQVLKDAAATAIYGSRAANGVVVITTKSGGGEAAKISANVYGGVMMPTNLPTMLNTQEYADLLWAAQLNSGVAPSNDLFGNGASPVIPEFLDSEGIVPANTSGTDWFEELFDPGSVQHYAVSVQNTSAKLSNYLSVSHLRQSGIMQHTNFARYNVQLNTSATLGKLTIGENLSLSSVTQQSAPTNQATGSRIIHAYRMNPIVPVRDLEGNFAGPVSGIQGAVNPVALNYLDQDDRLSTLRAFGSMYAEYELADGLFVKSRFGLDLIARNTKNYDPEYHMGITERGETSFLQRDERIAQFVSSNTLLYKRNIGEHFFSALAGTEAIRYQANFSGGASTGFVSDDIDYIQLNNGSGQSSNFSGGSEWALLSFFSRLDYSYNDKYLFSATVRRDGSSRFSPDNRFAHFPAFSAGWRVSQESFLKSFEWLQELKLRASWGQSGNQEIGDFSYFSTYSADAWDTYYAIDGSNDKAQIGFKPTRVGNEDVKWETTTQTNFGVDLATDFGLSASFDYFQKVTKDILIQRPTLAIEGQANAPFVNIGEMFNHGLEIVLGYDQAIEDDIAFGASVNMSVIRNEVKKLADDVVQLTGPVNTTFSRDLTLAVTQVGQPIAQFYGHIADGIFGSQPEVQSHAQQEGAGIGRIRYRDLDENGIIDDRDRTFIGSPHPELIGGVNLYFQYKRFDLKVLGQGVFGVDIYNFTRYYTDFFYDLGNRHSRVLDAWSPTNTDASVPMVAAVDINNELRPSTYFIEDGSYFRLKNIQASYQLPRIKETSCKVYVQAQNLFTMTKYQGVDPEISVLQADGQQNNLDIGIDRGIYPNARMFIIGLNLEI
ncbi:SusC/RagA family TonB-linked outer membrane protein [Marinoscillum furvescens]|nr:SusC/RagA family TonB-linked outer membrane protein [Marinoscillum furvescens]